MGVCAPVSSALDGVSLGWVRARGCMVGPSPDALATEVSRAVASVLDRGAEISTSRRAAVRGLLRYGRYKPTGRGKPASEYLLNAALEGRFPTINNLVDVNNLASIESLLPISLVDAGLAGTDLFRLRRGRPGESYVFNPSGQVLDLEDLLLLARLPSDVPCATPVKDSQATKTHTGTAEALGVVYAPAPLAREARLAAERMAVLFEAYCGARAECGGLP